jgi:phosphoserine phosphatase
MPSRHGRGFSNIAFALKAAEAVLNHISGHKAGVAGIYNKAVYRQEKAEALARWDKHLSKLAKE